MSEDQEKPRPGSAEARRARRFPRIRGQGRLATHQQLRDAEWTARAIQYAAATTFTVVHRGVFADHRGPLSDDDKLVAAALWAGRDTAVLTGVAALRRWGIEIHASNELLFLVPTTQRNRRSRGARTQRSRRTPRVTKQLRCVAITNPSRALCDAARYQKLGGDNLRAATIALLQRELVTVDSLGHELRTGEAHPLLKGVHQGLDSYTKGAWSLPEEGLRDLVTDDPLLGEMLFNPTLRLADGTFIGVPDGYLASVGVAFQVHSRAHHSGLDQQGKDRWSSTVEKDSVYPAHGIVVLGITPTSLRRRKAEVLARMRRVVQQAAERDLSHIVVHPWAPPRSS